MSIAQICGNCGGPLAKDAPVCASCGQGVFAGDQPTMGRPGGAAGAGLETARPETIPAADTTPTLFPTSLMDRFEELDVVGVGGCGTVHLVRDRNLDREVAVKIVATLDSQDAQRFQTEARLLAKLENDFVVRLYDAGVADGRPFLVMEYIHGPTLADHLAKGRPSVVEAVRLVCDILSGIEAAHAHGIVHRDLKPANVFLTENGRAKVADFGLAYRPAGLEGPKGKGKGETKAPADPSKALLVGTPGYMAPELIGGQTVGAAGDVYAAGIILHEMLTGHRLFAGRKLEEVIQDQIARIPPRPSEINPAVPRELDGLVARALDHDPAQRPTSAAFKVALSTWLDRATSHRPGADGRSYPTRPYRFLDHFGPEDTLLFCGRESEIAEIGAMLDSDETRVVFVFGPCGVGKSSLIRAGLAPALDPKRFDLSVLTSGGAPAAALFKLLGERWGFDGEGVGRKTDGRLPIAALVEAIERAGSDGRTQVVILDQLEEVFTQNDHGSPRIGALFELVTRIAELVEPRVKLILSFRTEFRGEFYPLEERIGRRQCSFGVREIDHRGLVSAIEAPARAGVYGFSYEDYFVERLARDVLAASRESRDAILPTMQIVCSQLVERARQAGVSTIGLGLYEEGLGGARGALARWVQERLESPAYAHRGAMARQILKALTIKDTGGERFARPCDEDELLAFPDRAAAARTLEHLIADRLVVRDVGEGGQRRVRLASEVVCSLIDQWELEPDACERAAKTLTRAFRTWVDGGRRPDDLLGGGALDLVKGHLPALRSVTPDERSFIEASATSRRWRRLVTGSGSVVVVVLLGLLGYAAFLRPGLLKLDTQPAGASVVLRGRSLGTTPLEWRANPGVYDLSVMKAGHTTMQVTVQVPAGGETRYTSVLGYPHGNLSVTSSPVGQCTIQAVELAPEARKAALSVPGGKITTVTPFVVELPAGTYRLSIAASGHAPAILERIVVEPNGKLTKPPAVTLKKNTGSLTVQTAFPGTSVAVFSAQGKRVASVDLPTKEPLDLPPGPYSLTVAGSNRVCDYRRAEVHRSSNSYCRVWTPPLRLLWRALAGVALVGPAASGRFDGDRTADLVVFSADGKLHAIGGRGGRELWSAPSGYSTTTPLPADLASPAIADLDGNGVTDVVVASPAGVLALAGDRGKPLWTSLVPGGLAVPPAIGDVSGDSRPDVVAASGDAALVLDGATGRELGRIAAPGIVGCTAGDVDGDGKAEIVLVTRDGSLRMFDGTGTSRFASRIDGTFRGTPALGDLDRDGILDVVVGLLECKIQAFSGRDGHLLWAGQTYGPVEGSPDLGCFLEPGVLDVGVTSAEGKFAVFLGRTGVRKWTREPEIYTGSVTPPVAGDVDGDGLADLVAGPMDSPKLDAVTGLQSGKNLWYALLPGKVRAPALLLDLDGDGTDDVVQPTSSGLLAIRGPGSPPPWVTFDTSAQLHGCPALADLDGDGIFDLVTTNTNSVTRAISGRTKSELWAFVHPRVAYSGFHVAVGGLADLDGDGKTDVTLSYKTGLVVALSGPAGRKLWEIQTAGLTGSCPVVGDLDGDRAPDVVVGAIDGRVHARRGRDGKELWTVRDGSAIFAPPGVGDLDGDGGDDVVACGLDGSAHALSGRDGRTLWQATLAFKSPGAPVVRDLDGDGRPDVVVGDKEGHTACLAGKDGRSLWRFDPASPAGRSPGTAGPAADSCPGEEQSFRAQGAATCGVGDLDRDGKQEVVVVTGTEVAALRGASGEVAWRRPVDRAVSQVPFLADADGDGLPDVWLSAADATVIVLGGRDGKPLGSFDIGLTYAYPPLVVTPAGKKGFTRTWLDQRIGEVRPGPAERPPLQVTVAYGEAITMAPRRPQFFAPASVPRRITEHSRRIVAEP